jgi:hypothetical protein
MGITPSDSLDYSKLRTVLSTGFCLPGEALQTVLRQMPDGVNGYMHRMKVLSLRAVSRQHRYYIKSRQLSLRKI